MSSTTASELAREVGPASSVAELVDASPEVLEVLEDFGIRLDPWTMIALKCTVKELAEYSAIRHPEDLSDAIRARLFAAEEP